MISLYGAPGVSKSFERDSAIDKTDAVTVGIEPSELDEKEVTSVDSLDSDFC